MASLCGVIRTSVSSAPSFIGAFFRSANGTTSVMASARKMTSRLPISVVTVVVLICKHDDVFRIHAGKQLSSRRLVDKAGIRFDNLQPLRPTHEIVLSHFA